MVESGTNENAATGSAGALDAKPKRARCGAACRTQEGRPCPVPPMNGATRCRMHGGGSARHAAHGNARHLERSRFVPRESLPEILSELATIQADGKTTVIETNLAERRVRRRHLPDDVAGDLEVALKLDGADRSDVETLTRVEAVKHAAESEGAVTLTMVDLSNPPVVTVRDHNGRAARLLQVGDLRLIQCADGAWRDAEQASDGSYRPILQLEQPE